MKIIIVEDEAHNIFHMKRLLNEIEPDIHIMGAFGSVRDTLAYLSNNEPPDLIFLDIRLNDGIGLGLLEKMGINIPVIFTTAYDEYAVSSFRFLNVDYLLKPFTGNKLINAISKYKQHFQPKEGDINLSRLKNILFRKKKDRSYICKIGKNHYPISVENIALFYTEEGETWVKTFEGKNYILNKTIEQLETEVDHNNFMRLNRKVICARTAVRKFKILPKSRLQIHTKPEAEFDVFVSTEKSSVFKYWVS